MAPLKEVKWRIFQQFFASQILCLGLRSSSFAIWRPREEAGVALGILSSIPRTRGRCIWKYFINFFGKALFNSISSPSCPPWTAVTALRWSSLPLPRLRPPWSYPPWPAGDSSSPACPWTASTPGGRPLKSGGWAERSVEAPWRGTAMGATRNCTGRRSWPACLTSRPGSRLKRYALWFPVPFFSPTVVLWFTKEHNSEHPESWEMEKLCFKIISWYPHNFLAFLEWDSRSSQKLGPAGSWEWDPESTATNSAVRYHRGRAGHPVWQAGVPTCPGPGQHASKLYIGRECRTGKTLTTINGQCQMVTLKHYIITLQVEQGVADIAPGAAQLDNQNVCTLTPKANGLQFRPTEAQLQAVCMATLPTPSHGIPKRQYSSWGNQGSCQTCTHCAILLKRNIL